MLLRRRIRLFLHRQIQDLCPVLLCNVQGLHHPLIGHALIRLDHHTLICRKGKKCPELNTELVIADRFLFKVELATLVNENNRNIFGIEPVVLISGRLIGIPSCWTKLLVRRK